MGKTTFAVCDSEKAYAEKIYEYIHATYPDRFEPVLFTGLQQFREYSMEKSAGVILVCEEMVDAFEWDDNKSAIIVLSKEKKDTVLGRKAIFKYRSAKEIMKKVMEYCAERRNDTIRRNCEKPLKVIGVYSPVKRTFQTTYALTLGQLLAEKGKALYLNFECFSGFDYMMQTLSCNKSDLMDLVYFWECGSENFSYRLGSITEKIGNLDYVRPVHSFMNFEGITTKQWTEFIRAFEEYTDYEYLILDLSEKLNGLFEILRVCSTVYSITDNRKISSAKMRQYETLLCECAYEDVLDKTRKLALPLFREIPENFELLPYSDLAGFIKKEIAFGDERYREERGVS